MENLNQKMLSGGVWMVGAQWAIRGIGMVSILILVRLIPPESFGLIAMATVFFGLLRVLGTFGFDSALIYRKNPASYLYDSAWTFNMLIGLAEAIILCALAIPIANFYNEPDLELVIYCLSIGFIINGVKNVGTVDFRKNLEFRKEFFYFSSQKVFSFLVTIPLAFILRNHWALIIGMVSGRLGECILGYFMHPHRARFSLRGWSELISFSKWVYFSNLLNFFARRSPELILGKVAGTSALAIYNVGFEIATIPTFEMISPINRALFPAFSKISERLDKLRKSYLDVSSMISLVVVPAGVGISVAAGTLVPLVLGTPWMDAIPVVQMIGIAGAVRGFLVGTEPVYLALGRPKLQTYIASLWLLILFPLAYHLGSEQGGVGIATAFLTAELLLLPIRVAILLKMLNMNFFDWAKSITRPLLASIVMYLVLFFVYRDIGSEDARTISQLFLDLLTMASSGIVIYTLSIFLLWYVVGRPIGAESRLISIIRQYGRSIIGT